MSSRYKGGVLSATPPATQTSSGTWTRAQQMQAKGASVWPTVPDAPTIGTATRGNAQATVTFSAPAYTGYPSTISTYQAVSTPGCFTASGASSPLTVTGLTNGTSYTFKVRAANLTGYSELSSASNSVTPSEPTCVAYTTPGTYTWVAPSCVTSVAVVAVGGGGGGAGGVGCSNYGGAGGGGGGLGYRNAQSVTSGNSYTVVVGAAGTKVGKNSNGLAGGTSYFINTSTVRGIGGCYGRVGTPCGGGSGGGYTGTGGNSGGRGGDSVNALDYRIAAGGGGGGASGYSGAGGAGARFGNGHPAGYCGSGGGGAGGGVMTVNFSVQQGQGGGGVGIYGQGANGTASASTYSSTPGGGGSCGASGCCVNGGAYGGGGGGGSYYLYAAGSGYCGGNGGAGAVRIVWCKGGSRGTPSFPSTNVGAS